MPRSSAYVAEPGSPLSPKSNGSRKSVSSRNSFREPESPRSTSSRQSSRSRVRVSTRKVAPDMAIRMMHHKADRERYIGTFVRKYAGGAGSIGRDQLRNMLDELSEGNEVTEEDVMHIMHSCDSRRIGFLTQENLVYAVSLWSDHIESLPFVEECMFKYDQNQSGYIDREELANFMEDIQGKPPTEKEVKWVMREADPSGKQQIGKWEIMRAYAAWNYRMKLKKRSRACALQ
eukprot:TRINITY_DN29459_c0_g1_i1.p1 TRINITY_DN29459_c0_g1~~TRINITY_DN29459_c0_g1_i1.p1  ORF type:complete len:232 (-),score=17.40 TRINITY_DN29459_c0_g1_i1:253-948(-)